MRSRTTWILAWLGILLGAAPGRAQAPAEEVGALRRQVEELTRTVQALEERLAAQDEAIRRLQEQEAAPAPEAVAAAPTAPAPAVTPPPPAPPIVPAAPQAAGYSAAGTTSSTYFNPSVSVIGNFLAAAGQGGDLPSADLRESELGLQAIVDPYARADVFLSFAQEGVDLEEGYMTFTKLPADLLLKVGRLRAYFGKVNTLHLHVLPWADEPLTIDNLLGEEGWIGTGVSLGRLIPLGDVFSEATLEVFSGDSGGPFAAPSRSDLSYNAHYRLFADLTESTNLDAGLSYAYGHNGVTDRSTTALGALDLTLRWKPLRTALYRGLTVRAEVISGRRGETIGAQHPFGWFLSGEYRLARRWSLGARLDAADRPDDDEATDRGRALLLTFSPSEFSMLRGELRRLSLAGGDERTDFLLQLQFAIGAHGAHPF